MPSEDVVATPFGSFLVTRGEIIGETTRAGTLWDGPGFLQVIAREYARLGEVGQTVIDVGANQGAFSIWLASQGAWRVLAVEPQPEVMRRLKANLDLNKPFTTDRVIPLEVAAYDRPCMLAPTELDPGNWGGTSFLPAERGVAADALDAYRWLCGARVSLIKIDAQGADGRVLLGLAKTLQLDRPAVVFEWEPELVDAHGLTWDALWRFLTFDVKYVIRAWPTHPNNFLALPLEEVRQ